MSARIRRHIRGNIYGLIALFIALGGTAYATHPGGANTISSGDIIDGQVRSPDIGTGQVRSDAVADDTTGFALTGTDIANASLTGSDVLDDNLTSADLATDSVTGDEVDNGTITGADVGLNTLSGADLAADSVGSDEVEPNALTAGDLGTSSVASDEIGSSGVDASELGAINERSLSVSVPAGGFNSATAPCAAGEQLISGGFNDPSLDLLVERSFRNGEGWFVSAANPDGTAHNLGVFAYCLNTP